MADETHKSCSSSARRVGGGDPCGASDPAVEANAHASSKGVMRGEGAPPPEATEPEAAPENAAEAPPKVTSSTEGMTNDDLADQRYRSLKTEIEAGVSRILEVFESKLAYDASKQLQIDRLHEELQQHRSDLAARAARPLVHGIIRLHDDIGKLLSALQGKPIDELSPERFFALLEGLQEDVEILLGQNGVAAYRDPVGPFDPTRQRVLRKIRTSDEALAGIVAESIRPGFEQGTEIIEKERVAIYQFEPELPEVENYASQETPEGDVSESASQEEEE